MLPPLVAAFRFGLIILNFCGQSTTCPGGTVFEVAELAKIITHEFVTRMSPATGVRDY
jgi:hypothetical protein